MYTILSRVEIEKGRESVSDKKKLREILASLSPQRAIVEKLNTDPITFPLRYPGLLDREIVALVAASFAFGRVAAIIKIVKQVLAPLGPSPAFTLQSTGPVELGRLYPTFRYRFVSHEGLIAFLSGIRHILLTSGTLNNLVKKEDPIETVDYIYRQLLSGSGNEQALLGSNLLADPKRGGPAKRWMLFLRWMVRKEFPDFGIWSHLISPSRLIIPLDTHVLRISRYLGFTDNTSPSMKVAREITGYLAELDRDDPLQFDFAIAHLGIDGICPRERDSRHCNICPLQEFCKEGRITVNRKSKTGRAL